jgi:hypothetical protein
VCECIILSFVVSVAVPSFSTISRKMQDFREKVFERKMCDLIFSTTLPEIFFILRRMQRDAVINIHRS